MIREEQGVTKPRESHNKTQPHTTKTPRMAPAPESTARPAVDTLPPPPCDRRPFAGFDRERATYQRLKPDLLASVEGKYVVIVGDEVVGPLESHEEAERGLEPGKWPGLGPYTSSRSWSRNPSSRLPDGMAFEQEPPRLSEDHSMNDVNTLPAPDLGQKETTPDAWEAEHLAFIRLLPTLLASHEGQYVAVHQGCVTAEGLNQIEVAKQAYRR